MTTIQQLQQLVDRAKDWPESLQKELLTIASELEVDITGEYHASEAELRLIDEGLRDADAGNFLTAQQTEDIFAKYRHA